MLTVGLVMTIDANGFAYQVKTTAQGNLVRWQRSLVKFRVDSSATADQLQTIQKSFAEWTSLANLALDYAGPSRDADPGYDPNLGDDNENSIRFEAKRWDADEDVLAVTYTLHESRSGKIVSADIVVNAVDFKWSSDGRPGTEDIANVLTHEVGHFIGLGHSNVAEATMYPSASHGETQKRDLADDDRDGLRALYGSASSSASTASTALSDSPGAGTEPAPANADTPAAIAAAHGCSTAPLTNDIASSGTALITFIGLAAFATVRRRTSIARR